MSETIRNSDSHYRDIESNSQTEPIVIMEELITRLIEAGVPPAKALNLTLSQKHLTRSGVKVGEDWAKEIEKSMNYQHRAIHGVWRS